MDELKELLRRARLARTRGMSIEDANSKIQEATSGQFAGLAALSAHVEAEDPRLLASAETSASSDFGRMFAQGSTFGFGDEIAALGPKGIAQVLAGDAVGAVREFMSPKAQERLLASRDRVENIRALNPGASLMAEIAGGAAIPLAGGTQVARAAGGGLRGAAAGGAVAGATGGGLFGLGEAEGTLPERLPAAAVGAGVGAAAGGLLGVGVGAAGPVIARGARRVPVLRQFLPEAAPPPPLQRQPVMGEAIREVTPLQSVDRAKRFADEIERLTGIDSALVPAEEAADKALQRVRTQFFKPLEEAFDEIVDPEILALLRRADFKSNTRVVARGVEEAGGRGPSFTELQGIQQRLRGRLSAAERRGRSDLVSTLGNQLDELDAVMEQGIPGLKAANRAWHEAQSVRRAFAMGQKSLNQSAERTAQDLAQLPTDEARLAFQRGLQNRIVLQLRLTEGSSSGAINKLLKAGPEMRARLQNLFRGEENFQTFIQIVEREKSVKARAKLIRETFPWLVGATVLGGAGGFVAGRALFGGGQ